MSTELRAITHLSGRVAQIVAERDELARQLEEARRLACHYADLLHLAHDSAGIIERDWKAS